MSVEKINIRVEFSSSQQQLDWLPQDQNLLQAAERIGLKFRYGCRRGFCGSCKVVVEQGRAKLLWPTCVDLEQNEILLCSSIPDSRLLVLEC